MAYLLIIDDDEDFASAAATVLRGEGYEVQVEVTPERGLASMRKRCPDLVVLDVMFPEDNAAGLELARKMRAVTGKLKNVPVLMLTAVNQSFPLGLNATDIDDAWLPVNDFVEKPLDFDKLKSKVASLLDQASSGPGQAEEDTQQ